MLWYFSVQMKAAITVDEVGRLVLPKGIREAIGVFGRMSLQAEVVQNTLYITAPEPARQPVSRKRGRTVYEGPLPENWDSGEAVMRLREQKIRR